MKRTMDGIKTGSTADGSCESRQERFVLLYLLKRMNEGKSCTYKERVCTYITRAKREREKERWVEGGWGMKGREKERERVGQRLPGNSARVG